MIDSRISQEIIDTVDSRFDQLRRQQPYRSYGTVATVDTANRRVSVYVSADPAPSAGFTYPPRMDHPVVGSRVRVVIDPRGDRYVEENLAVPTAESGTSFPAQPAYGNNRPFLRTDRGVSYYYDGTRWLSTTRYTTQLNIGARPAGTDMRSFTAAQASAFYLSRDDAAHRWVENFNLSFYDASANNNPMFWGADLYHVPGGGAVRSRKWGRQDFGLARSQWTLGMTTASGGPWVPFLWDGPILEVDLVPTNSPGTLYLAPFVRWREVG